MTSTTENIFLTVYNTSSDENVPFATWLTDVAGDTVNSNMVKIDAAIGELQDKFASRTKWFYVPVIEARVGEEEPYTQLYRITNGFGYRTRRNYFTHFASSFMVPGDYVSDMRVHQIWSNRDEFQNSVIAVHLAANVMTTMPDLAPSDPNDLSFLSAVPVQLIISPNTYNTSVYVDMPGVYQFDMCEVNSYRNGNHGSDVTDIPFGAQFHGWMVSYNGVLNNQ